MYYYLKISICIFIFICIYLCIYVYIKTNNNNTNNKLLNINNKLLNINNNTNNNTNTNTNKRLFFNNCDIYYINLDRSKDRNKVMIEQSIKHELNIKRISAVDGKKINLDNKKLDFFLKNLRQHFKKNQQRLGHLGVFFSHLNIFKLFNKSNKDYCIIMEDDCYITTNTFKNDIVNNLKNIPSDWDIILCGYHIDDDWSKEHKIYNKDLKYNKGILNINYFTGLHCYIINKKSVKKLLSSLIQPTWYIDWEISKLAYQNKLKIYGIFPPIVCQPAAFRVKVNDINYNYKCKYYFKTTTNI